MSRACAGGVPALPTRHLRADDNHPGCMPSARHLHATRAPMAAVQGACRLPVITGCLAIYPQFASPGAERVAVLGAHGFLSCVGRRRLAWGGALGRGWHSPGYLSSPAGRPASTSLASARPRGSSVRRAYCTETVLGLALGTVTVRMPLSWEALTSSSMLSSPASSAGSATAWTSPRSRR